MVAGRRRETRFRRSVNRRIPLKQQGLQKTWWLVTGFRDWYLLRVLDSLLSRLEEAKRRFGPGEAGRTARLLAAVAKRRFPDAPSLIRLHEVLLFLRAYPARREIARLAVEQLSSVHERVERLRSAGADLDPFEAPEVSGIAGTEFSAILSYEAVRRLVAAFPAEIRLEWDNYEVTDRLAGSWRRFLPLLEEDSMVEAHVPYVEWLRAALPAGTRELPWLVRRFELLPLCAKDKEDLWNALELPVRWDLGRSRAARTTMRRPAGRLFCHETPLIRRGEVSLDAELASPPLPLKRLPLSEGERLLDMARATSAVRFRELHGFTYGDPAHVDRVTIGRGVEIFVCGVPPERRLPLRAYHAAMFFKNGVPIGYFETLTLFERMEVGFNVYYTFRDGESAWLLGRTLRLFRQLLGVSVFSIDPYQIGHDNEEAIEAGAFWFYRKLGFRPVRAELRRLAEAEESKLRRDPAHRTPARTLRKLAQGHMVYEMPGVVQADWDAFHIRNVGLAVQRRMAERFGGEADKIRDAARAKLSRILGVKAGEAQAFEHFAVLLSGIPDLERWSDADKAALEAIIRAKSAPEEFRYVRLLQRHLRLREVVLRLGTAAPS